MTAQKDISPPFELLLKVFLPFAGGYFLSYLYRTVNAIISPDLVREFSLGPDDLGLLTSSYFLAFALFQLPLGILLDRYGPRRVNASLLMIAASGAAFFGLSQSLPGLIVARALIGLGVSGCLMSSMKVFTLWFPLNRLATLNGWLLSCGGLGALAASKPAEALLRITDWHSMFLLLAALTFAAAGAIFLIVPERQAPQAPQSLMQSLKSLPPILRNANFWRLGLLAIAGQGVAMSLQSLWIAPWLKDVVGLPRADIGNHLLMIALGMIVGAALWGVVADWLSHRGVDTVKVVLGGVGANLVILLLLALGVKVGTLFLMFALTLFSQVLPLIYAVLSKEFPLELSGRVISTLNFLVFLSAFAVQWGTGLIINLWPVEAGRYAAAGYGTAFGVCVVLLFVPYVLLLQSRRPAASPR
ncbi:MAG: MFS transporter [Burkholderiales bacterium]|nr:MFS transporter [Burkholderiales bacterium]